MHGLNGHRHLLLITAYFPFTASGVMSVDLVVAAFLLLAWPLTIVESYDPFRYDRECLLTLIFCVCVCVCVSECGLARATLWE